MPTTDSVIRGRLKALSIADVLVFLKGLGRPGRLEVSCDNDEVALDLRGGFVVRAASNRPADRLEEVLLTDGRIGVEQRDAALLIEARNQEAGIGRALVESGALTSRDLVEARRRQARRIVLALFDWSQGEYRFEERQTPSGWSAPLDLPVLDLVADGIRRVQDAEMFRERIPASDWVFEPSADGPGGVRLEPQERHLLELLDGRRTVADLETGTEYASAETRRILFLLLTLGQIRPRSEATQPSEDPQAEPMEDLVRRFNGIYGRVYQYMTLELGPISDDLLTASLRDIEPLHAPLFARAQLQGDGTLDEGTLGDNLRSVSRRERRDRLVQGLSELLYRELLVVRQALGEEHERRVLNALRRDRLLAPGTF